MQIRKQKALLLMGPTASGKTTLALELAARFPVEIVSVDSSMVYRETTIGTAKPADEVLQRIPHHLVNIRTCDQPYSAGLFCEDARRLMAEIAARGKVPLLTGGTLLYFRALEHGLSPLPVAAAAVRQKINEQALELGWQKMHARLVEIDPQAGRTIQPGDRQRIQRALEVHHITGQPLSTLQATAVPGIGDSYRIYRLVLYPTDRQELHRIIVERFSGMLKSGLVEEVEALLPNRLAAPPPCMRAVGYRQVSDYLKGRTSYQEMQNLAVIATRQLAKRQMTWLRGNPGGYWFGVPDTAGFRMLFRLVENLLAE